MASSTTSSTAGSTVICPRPRPPPTGASRSRDSNPDSNASMNRCSPSLTDSWGHAALRWSETARRSRGCSPPECTKARDPPRSSLPCRCGHSSQTARPALPREEPSTSARASCTRKGRCGRFASHRWPVPERWQSAPTVIVGYFPAAGARTESAALGLATEDTVTGSFSKLARETRRHLRADRRLRPGRGGRPRCHGRGSGRGL